MKKITLLFFLLFFVFPSVSAKDFYKNSRGLTFTKEEYDIVSKMYFDGYQEFISYDEFNILKKYNIEIENISSEILNYSDIVLFASSYETPMKELKVSYSCKTNCVVTVTLRWKNNPVIRSYDLLGIYFKNNSFTSKPSTYLLYSTNKLSPSKTISASNGFSAIIKLPSTDDSIKIVQTYIMNNKGNINVSYQHSQKTISLADSQKFSFSSDGVGGVFKFNSSIGNYFDGMRGLIVNLK